MAGDFKELNKLSLGFDSFEISLKLKKRIFGGH
jgi:hypothetical protein